MDLLCSLEISCNGYKYFLNIVDDFSHFTWLFMLKTKDRTLLFFQYFLRMVQNQFNMIVISIQIDSNGEFIFFKSFLTKSGILHNFSCPYTSMKNGLIESRHRRIMEKRVRYALSSIHTSLILDLCCEKSCVPYE